MNKLLKVIRKGLVFTAASLTTASLGGFAYLLYVNSILGPIDIDKHEAISFYKETHKMGDS